jgi:hypothetical protein
MDWTIGEAGFDSSLGTDFYFSPRYSDRLRGIPASYSLSTGWGGDFFLRRKYGRRVKLTIHHHLVPKFKKERSYTFIAPYTFIVCLLSKGINLTVILYCVSSKNVNLSAGTLWKPMEELRYTSMHCYSRLCIQSMVTFILGKAGPYEGVKRETSCPYRNR